MPDIQPITMPKWGLAMEEGVLARWAVEEGAQIAAGQEIMDIETTKIANVFESPVAGVLRKKVVPDGETVPVGALLGVVAEPGVDEAHPRCGMAADVAGLVAERAFGALRAPIRMVTAPHAPVPFSPALEDLYIPSVAKIEAAVLEVVGYGARAAAE